MQGLREIITPRDTKEAASLLDEAGLSLPSPVDFGLGLYEDGRLRAAGFLAGNLLCGLAVSPERQGEGLAATIAGGLMERGRESGLSHFLLITKVDEADKFSGLGFVEVARSDRAAFLEFGRPAYNDWMQGARRRLAGHAASVEHAAGSGGGVGSAAGNGRLAAVVMNANPFTLGHRRLVEAALAGAGRVAVFVVEEEASAFPFAARLALVCEGLADLPEAIVLPGGPYMVSRASFPSYFTGEREHTAAHAALDAALFAARIAPDLGIGSRYVGTEPLCSVTAAYNEALRDILPRHGIDVIEIERLALDGMSVSMPASAPVSAASISGGTLVSSPVSASGVRALLAAVKPDWRAIAALVPETTLLYLQSAAAAQALERLGTRGGRH